MTQNFIACRLEENFPDPLKFKPERWLKSPNQQKLNVNPFLVIPFGHGMRSCIARRFAEQSMLVFLLRVRNFKLNHILKRITLIIFLQLMRSYSLEWKGGEEEMDVITELINKPSCDISIKFTKREN